MKTLDDFKLFVKQKVQSNWYVSASAVTGMFMYYTTIEKPSSVTVSYYTWLRSIAQKEIQDFKSTKTAY